MPLTQDKREFQITSPLGPDVLVLRRMSGIEELGRLGEYHLDLLSEQSSIAVADILGKSVTVSISLGNDQERFVNGYVTRFCYMGAEGRHFAYQATLRPWLWFLTRASNCRIFQNKTVPEIIQAVFDEHQLPDYDLAGLSATYEAREYCVQYRETDFDFVSRLMEDEGIYYFFRHADGQHTMVLADSYSAHVAVPGVSEIPFKPWEAAEGRRTHSIVQWATAAEVETGSYALKDYHFETPSTDLLVTSQISRTHDHSAVAMYDYPGGYTTTALGDTYARVRIEGLQAPHQQASASAKARNLHAGGLFTLIDHPRDDQNAEYLVVSASCTLSAQALQTGGGGGGEEFACEVLAIPSDQPFRAARITPKPVVRGPQTAVVTGKSGEEIWTDQYGRIKVHFHWDREGTSDENSSCWVRVAQNWAGKNWGTFFLPRMGQEVVVDFLEGDPDRPLVTGSVYNAEQMPPYTLPDEKTKSVIKTRSSKQGDAAKFNEIRFEDLKDSEEIYVHAEKDMNRVVENNDTLKIGFEKKDKGDQTTEIYNDQSIEVGNDQTIKIGLKRASPGDQKVDIKNDQTINVGNKIYIEAKTSIELVVGGSSIKIEPAKITITTTTLEVKGNATVKVESGGIMETKSTGPMTIQGAVVKIN